MKKLKELQNNFLDKKLFEEYDEVIQSYFDKLAGKIVFRRKEDYKTVFIVSVILNKNTMPYSIRVTFLDGSNTYSFDYRNWNELRQDLLHKSEFDEKKDIIRAIKRTKEDLKKMPRKGKNFSRQRSFVRYK